MNMLWPGFLLLLGLIPLMLGIYIWVLRRRQKYAVRYSSLALVREALPRYSRLRRHLPFALFLLGLASLLFALVRPVTSVYVPTSQTAVILSMDVSWSMCSSDIPPNRLTVAQDAARSFIRGQKSNTQIGIVAFAGFAQLIQPPTDDKDTLEAGINGLYTARRTAIGSAILSSLDTIAEIDGRVAPSTPVLSSQAEITPLPDGTYLPHIIVLLTDGASNAGPSPLDAAQQAAERGIRVYTIGFGTEEGGPFTGCASLYQRDGFYGGGGFGFGSGGGFRRGIDEATLIKVAEMTGGEYFSASSANELDGVFRSIPITLITRRETMEISVIFTAISALLTTATIILSQLWNRLP